MREWTQCIPTMKHLFALIATLPLVVLARAQAPAELSGDFSSSFRSFGNAPEGQYGSATLRLNTSPHGSVFVSAASGATGLTAAAGKTVVFGGNDIELGAQYCAGSRGLGGAVGVSFPGTAANTSAVTYHLFQQIGDGFAVGLEGFSGTFGVLAAQISEDTKLRGNFSFHAGISLPLSGYSTVSLNTGDEVRTVLLDAALKLSFDSANSLSIGITNRLGDTTMFSLSSPVGNRYGYVISYGAKF